MSGFHYKDGILHADDISMVDIASEYGTPSYVYCLTEIKKQILALKQALRGSLHPDNRPLIAYACKANSNQAILNYMAQQECGCDVVSGGELSRALQAGIPAERIVFSGVGKTDEEILQALQAGIHQINVESLPELRRIIAIAEHSTISVAVAFRMNPDVEAGTHAKITTGKSDNKFGMLRGDIKVAYKLCEGSEFVEPVGLSMHIGSQLTALGPYREAFGVMADFVNELRSDGHEITRLDIGGGLGVIYDDEKPIDPAAYTDLIKEIIEPLDTQIILEPGRYLTANAGVLISRVIYAKESENRNYLILDAGMNDLMRPALYEAYHSIRPVMEQGGRKSRAYDVVGPVCETGDTFAKDREIEEAKDGELIAMMSAGAYGAAMGSNYNTRALPAEILVEGRNSVVIRQRQDIQDIIKKDIIPDWLDTD